MSFIYMHTSLTHMFCLLTGEATDGG